MVVADTAAVADMVAVIATKPTGQPPKPDFFGLPSGFPPDAEAESFSPLSKLLQEGQSWVLSSSHFRIMLRKSFESSVLSSW